MNKFKCISFCCLWIYLSSIATVDARGKFDFQKLVFDVFNIFDNFILVFL